MSDNKETKQALDTSLACMMPTMQFPRQPVEQAPAVEAWSEACASCATPRACQYDGCRHDETQAQEPIDYDRVVQICEAHGIGLPVDCVEMVVEIIRLAAPQAAGAPIYEVIRGDARENCWITVEVGVYNATPAYRRRIVYAAPQPASEPESSCDPADICAGCRCKYNTYAHPASEQQAEPIAALVAEHAKLLDQNDYAYFELAYTRQTGWMAWLTDRPARGEPGTAEYAKSRKVIARGQGDTAQEACQDALNILAAKGDCQ